MISDNRFTFVSAAKTIHKIVTDPSIARYMSESRMDWRFNIEKAPWWGGILGRMIGLMNRCLRKIIGRSKLTYDELLTAATEVELILNSRPLTFVSSNDKEEPLTPSHLIVGRGLSNLPDELCYRRIAEEFPNEVSPTLLNHRLRYFHNVMDKFWSRWRNGCLLSLRERYPSGHRKSSQRIIKIGDIVVVHSDELPRSFWRLNIESWK